MGGKRAARTMFALVVATTMYDIVAIPLALSRFLIQYRNSEGAAQPLSSKSKFKLRHYRAALRAMPRLPIGHVAQSSTISSRNVAASSTPRI